MPHGYWFPAAEGLTKTNAADSKAVTTGSRPFWWDTGYLGRYDEYDSGWSQVYGEIRVAEFDPEVSSGDTFYLVCDSVAMKHRWNNVESTFNDQVDVTGEMEICVITSSFNYSGITYATARDMSVSYSVTEISEIDVQVSGGTSLSTGDSIDTDDIVFEISSSDTVYGALIRERGTDTFTATDAGPTSSSGRYIQIAATQTPTFYVIS